MTLQAAAMHGMKAGRARKFSIDHGYAASIALHSALFLAFAVINSSAWEEDDESTLVFE